MTAMLIQDKKKIKNRCLALALGLIACAFFVIVFLKGKQLIQSKAHEMIRKTRNY